MRIVYIAAGAGDMYCGACARDITLVNGLIALGHEVQIMPLYTPLRSDNENILPTTPIFYGGINVYLKNLSPIFRHMPAFVDRALDNPALLRIISKWAIKTHPKDLGPMTVSVLAGSDGHQQKELQLVLGYLQKDARPEIVDITNSLLSGIAPQLKNQLDATVICTLQGEDSFIEALPEPYKSKAQELIHKNAQSVDLFIATGESYATKMADFIGVSPEKIRVIRAGVDLETYKPAPKRASEPFTIGYLSVINPTKGLDLLVDAFSLIAGEHGSDAKLHVAGKVLNQDYWNSIKGKIAARGLSSQFEYLGEVTLAQKQEFLQECSVFSVPSRIGESRGMAVMEAMASGAPVVVPNTGGFPEIIGLTGGGSLFASGDVNSLAHTLSYFRENPDASDKMGLAASEGIAKYYSAKRMTDEVSGVYEEAIAETKRNPRGPETP